MLVVEEGMAVTRTQIIVAFVMAGPLLVPPSMAAKGSAQASTADSATGFLAAHATIPLRTALPTPARSAERVGTEVNERGAGSDTFPEWDCPAFSNQLSLDRPGVCVAPDLGPIRYAAVSKSDKTWII